MTRSNGFTRREALAAVKLHGSITADELGRALGISPVAARQHLASLEAEGLVTASVERRSVGRPVHRYRLSQEGDETFPRSYDALAITLIEELKATGGEETVDALFARRRARQVQALSARLAGHQLPDQVKAIAEHQTEAGYMATTREDGASLLLVEHNCAICRVARVCPTACEHELAMFRDVLGEQAEVERVSHIQSGDASCTYRITPRPR